MVVGVSFVLLLIVLCRLTHTDDNHERLLLNICFDWSCKTTAYLQMSPSFQSDIYDYDVVIPKIYTFYTYNVSMLVQFYVAMNASFQENIVSKCLVFNRLDEVLYTSELAYSSNEMMALAPILWQSAAYSPPDDTNTFTIHLRVYQFKPHDNPKTSALYRIRFHRNG
ncbi:unnamed protein product [Didymodactylos carnosus]|uniref:Uncharacterized protein n=2 Tax=Didymodactylos carnosus TaxID=1234261 RepID=A0A815BC88_9BILA|nr:unnamed protein product [Didymodactylos carnosus]CAF4053430.1 unnamed protein product [Didymodactylos carnosus]